MRSNILDGVFRIALLAALLTFGCRGGGDADKGGNVPKRDIQEVMKEHVDELMAIPGVVAVAIGELDDGTPCIKVLLAEDSAEARRRIPASLDGHSVVVEVSGEIRAMDENGEG